MRYGFRKGLWNILGLQLGVLWLILISALGLGALLVSSLQAFNVLKYAGSLYLVWLGVQQWRAENSPVCLTATQAQSRRQLFIQGFLVNASNPKGILFMLAVLPQFIDPHARLLPQYIVCTLTLFVTDVISMGAYTLLAARMLTALNQPQHLRWVRRIFALLFVLAGLALAGFKHR